MTPGNPGMAPRTAAAAESAQFALAATGITVTADAPEDVDAELFVIGPEQPLVDGLADRLRADRRLVFGPGADGARLEGSKAFMKAVLAEAGVPTARRRRLRRDQRRPGLPARAARALGGEDRRPRRGQGRARHRLARPRPRRTSPPNCRGRASATRAGAWWWKKAWWAPSALCSCSVMGLASRRWRRRRTSSASVTATRGPTRGAWGRTRPCPSSTTGSSTACSTGPWSRSWGRCGGGGSTTGACCTPGSSSPPTGRASSSTTCASAIPRPRSCCPGSPRTSRDCWPRRPRAGCAPSRASPPTRRWAWCWPRRAIPARPAPATASTGWRRPPPWRASPCSTPAPTSTPRGASSPPGGGCSPSAPPAPSITEARRRAPTPRWTASVGRGCSTAPTSPPRRRRLRPRRRPAAAAASAVPSVAPA